MLEGVKDKICIQVEDIINNQLWTQVDTKVWYMVMMQVKLKVGNQSFFSDLNIAGELVYDQLWEHTYV